ncbi:MAG TPA: DUF4192 domain-containing protein [Jatrophihabitans sp.]|jgi:hypothetical protein|uniref:DUF4192 domain-containing protein n=1 Tax=Jatrophihabitans sp. TaxID=1932789 RepID=UPI002E0ADFFF|nr:DUF4192 domain-containing protein [Jatrophihabitans sp.]
MTISEYAGSASAPHRISGPGELLQAVPYLLGFHPLASLVLVGLDRHRLVVTARLDLIDTDPPTVAHAVDTMRRGGAQQFVAAIYDDAARPDRGEPMLPRDALAARVQAEVLDQDGEVVDVLLVSRGRWWSYRCQEAECCPPQGREIPASPSAFAAAATYAGVVALPDRAALGAALDPVGDPHALQPLLEQAAHDAVGAVRRGDIARHERSVKRAMFAAARESDTPGWPGLGAADRARFGVALREIPLRDSVWMAADDRRIDGRALWRHLATTLPPPYAAPPLFLFGWVSWRKGEGALAAIAAERAVASDPDYSAADLLLAALSRGLDPRRLPKLRLPRTA